MSTGHGVGEPGCGPTHALGPLMGAEPLPTWGLIPAKLGHAGLPATPIQPLAGGLNPEP